MSTRNRNRTAGLRWDEVAEALEAMANTLRDLADKLEAELTGATRPTLTVVKGGKDA